MLASCLRLLLVAHSQPYHQRALFNHTTEFFACRSFLILSNYISSAELRLLSEVLQGRLLRSSSREESHQEILNLLHPSSISSDRALRYVRPP